MKRGGSHALDLPMAALAAVSVAFVAYAMPAALFSDVVTASGLPSILPAAQPPLGTTARLAVVVPAAVAAFIFTWLMLRALGNGAPSSRRSRETSEAEPPPLRLRRADAHPDAPLRRPLVAGLDLGEPSPVEDTGEEERPLPTFIETEAIADDDWFDAPEEEWTGDDREALPPMQLEEPTIAHLMQRLELGLIRRQQQDGSAAVEAEQPRTAETPFAVDDRLRSALDDLQRMAARGA